VTEEINFFFRVRDAVIGVATDEDNDIQKVKGKETAIGAIFDSVGIPDYREAFAPKSDTTGYNYLIKGIVVREDTSLANEEKERLENYNIRLRPYNEACIEESAEGEFLIKVNSLGEYTVEISCTGYITKKVSVNLDDTTHYDIGYIALEPKEIDVNGCIVDALTGEPIKGITLRLFGKGNKQNTAPLLETISDENGCYEMENILVNEYRIQLVDEREEEENPYETQSFDFKVVGEMSSEEHDFFLSRPEYKREFNGNTYQLFGAGLLWADAEKYCEQLGGYLVCVGSKEENEFLNEWFIEQGFLWANIGYTDREEEGIWKWLSGEEPEYENWHRGEPNNGLSFIENQNYAYMKDDGTWDDGRNVDLGAFFCEWESEEEE